MNLPAWRRGRTGSRPAARFARSPYTTDCASRSFCGLLRSLGASRRLAPRALHAAGDPDQGPRYPPTSGDREHSRGQRTAPTIGGERGIPVRAVRWVIRGWGTPAGHMASLPSPAPSKRRAVEARQHTAGVRSRRPLRPELHFRSTPGAKGPQLVLALVPGSSVHESRSSRVGPEHRSGTVRS